MITGIACLIGGIFFQKFFPFFGDIVVSKVQAGFKYVVGLFGGKKDEPKQ
jgi:hypothetical protein